MGLKRKTLPTKLPVEVAEVKLAARLNANELDSEIRRLIQAATSRAEDYTGQSFMTQTWVLALDRFPPQIKLPRGPLASVVSINYVDSQGSLTLLDPSQYRVSQYREPATIEPEYNATWPTTRTVSEAVQVEFTAGVDEAKDVPQAARQAIIVMCRDDLDETDHSQNVNWLLDSVRSGWDAAWLGV